MSFSLLFVTLTKKNSTCNIQKKKNNNNNNDVHVHSLGTCLIHCNDYYMGIGISILRKKGPIAAGQKPPLKVHLTFSGRCYCGG